VVIPASSDAPARHHTFSQFGAGTLVPGVVTILVDPMVVHPTALLVEAEALGRIGIHDALLRLKIDAQCRVTTPYHQAAGRLRELVRGAAAHGTCGVGVGETVRHSLEHPDQVLRYADLLPSSATHRAAQLNKLHAIRESLWAELAPLFATASTAALNENAELLILQDETLAATWLNQCQPLARQCPPAGAELIRTQMTQPGCILFEGAQGVLLDEWRGFHPHTTWSSISTVAVNGIARRFGIDTPIEHYGVLRTYLTRHGPGPQPTHDASLDDLLPEPHNSGQGWQGPFRRGHPDSVLLRYALDVVGDLSGLLISHLDVFDRGVALRWCEQYIANSPSESESSNPVDRLPVSDGEDLSHQSMLTKLLLSAQPQYAAESIHSPKAFLNCIASVTDLPVTLGSYGPSFAEVRKV
jgi:adenylosuccinate synthase